MSPEAQRIAIAEACGYFHAMRGIDVWYEREGGHVVFGDLPDYLTDLNAMNEAEKVLNMGQQQIYTEHLHRLPPAVLSYMEKDYFILHATAAQRAEAFLRTLNLWKEE